ncbi:unnamed protein product [Aphanomyces euteiches]|uniref:CCT domain-containing protein n=1 Tax=Aphanomyces euteiches TaxID=100861 RepID=A0A6G0XVM4_9STRA|nr:hypothetical protein Ae201684_001011 [Aphanomyces euteiches]KAH9099419.1 hypothetical protein Ae201684P_018435 [Aphanomyces euteiches]KAH9110684.1 hypothetical protein LEN26_013675 [Aphanomyces euteiches]KAH9116846.1 hypothetical protein AeMF1_009249 [Aphanomyces euteiches]KAH9131572.1 hypothetical protein AeNC1_019557 [Aphanomyces euteiches]
MMLGMYAEDPLAKQSQHAQAHVQAKNVGADTAVDVLDGDLNWFTDGGIIRMEEFGNDIDWVHEELEQSLHLQSTHGDSEDLFAREFSPYAPPATAISLETTSQHHPTASDGLPLSGDLRSCDANEKLLMSFDTMSYTTPSPVSSPRHRENDLLDDDTMDDDMEDNEDGDDDDDDSMDAPSSNLLHSSVSDLESHIHGLMLLPPSKSSSTTSPSKPSDKVISDGKFKKMFEPIVHQRTIGAYTPTARKLRLEKFHEKRKKRIWKKSIKYDCRKKLADDRPRIKGRFVRVLENLVSKTEDEKSEDAPPTTTLATTPTPLPTAVTPAVPSMVPATLVVASNEVTPTQGNSPLAAVPPTTLSPTVNSIHFGSFGSFPSPVVMVKLEPPAFPLVGRAILG